MSPIFLPLVQLKSCYMDMLTVYPTLGMWNLALQGASLRPLPICFGWMVFFLQSGDSMYTSDQVNGVVVIWLRDRWLIISLLFFSSPVCFDNSSPNQFCIVSASIFLNIYNVQCCGNHLKWYEIKYVDFLLETLVLDFMLDIWVMRKYIARKSLLISLYLGYKYVFFILSEVKL